MSALSADRLRSVLAYCSVSGQFRWLQPRGNRAAGSIAGSPEAKGYIRIAVDGLRYKAQVLAWLHVTGEFPASQIDHRDGDPTNNRWANLRPASNAQNCANQRTPRSNRSGFKGVSERGGRFIAGIKVAYRRHNLGTFSTPEAAAGAYDKAAVAHFGAFARLNFPMETTR